MSLRRGDGTTSFRRSDGGQLRRVDTARSGLLRTVSIRTNKTGTSGGGGGGGLLKSRGSGVMSDTSSGHHSGSRRDKEADDHRSQRLQLVVAQGRADARKRVDEYHNARSSNQRIFQAECGRWEVEPNQEFLESLSSQRSDYTLVAIDQSGQQLTTLQPYMDLIRMNKRLRSIDFSENRIDEESLATLVDCVRNHPSVTSLNISGCLDWNGAVLGLIHKLGRESPDLEIVLHRKQGSQGPPVYQGKEDLDGWKGSVPENILFFVDQSPEMGQEVAPGLTRMDLVKRALHVFIHTKKMMNSAHEFSICGLREQAVDLAPRERAFGRSMTDLSKRINDILPIASALKDNPIDFTSIMEICETKMEADRQPGHPAVYRAIILFTRTVPPILTPTATSRRMYQQEGFFCDVVYMHKQVAASSYYQLQEVFHACTKMGRDHAQESSYIFECATVIDGPTSLHNFYNRMGTLLAHPLQRPYNQIDFGADLGDKQMLTVGELDRLADKTATATGKKKAAGEDEEEEETPLSFAPAPAPHQLTIQHYLESRKRVETEYPELGDVHVLDREASRSSMASERSTHSGSHSSARSGAAAGDGRVPVTPRGVVHSVPSPGAIASPTVDSLQVIASRAPPSVSRELLFPGREVQEGDFTEVQEKQSSTWKPADTEDRVRRQIHVRMRRGVDTQNIDRTFICAVCKDVVNDPLAGSHCYHVFCPHCIDELKRRQATACPTCHRRLHFLELKEPPLEYLKSLSELRFQCPFGCGEEITQGDRRAHYKVCDLAYVQCPNHPCEWFGQRMDFTAHAISCQHRCLECNHCSQRVPAPLAKVHLTQECPELHISCHMCQSKIRRADMMNHLENECGEADSACQWADMGCTFRSSIDGVNKHLNHGCLFNELMRSLYAFTGRLEDMAVSAREQGILYLEQTLKMVLESTFGVTEFRQLVSDEFGKYDLRRRLVGSLIEALGTPIEYDQRYSSISFLFSPRGAQPFVLHITLPSNVQDRDDVPVPQMTLTSLVYSEEQLGNPGNHQPASCKLQKNFTVAADWPVPNVASAVRNKVLAVGPSFAGLCAMSQYTSVYSKPE